MMARERETQARIEFNEQVILDMQDEHAGLKTKRNRKAGRKNDKALR